MSRPRVLLADDHVMLAEGLKRLLADDFELVGFVEDGRALVAAARKLAPDVVVADISMPHLNGLEAIARLKRETPGLAVVVLTMHQNPAYARRAFEAGAAGYVVKHAAPAELVTAIRAALRGQRFVSPALVVEEKAAAPVTPRQREILQLLAEGLSAKQVAEALAISPRTVEFHKYQLMEAHGLKNSAELIHFAIRSGIVTI
jgi:DNA-binding NarL/FixJ family response regulator